MNPQDTSEKNTSIDGDSKELRRAEFDDAVTSYWLTNGAIICVATIVGIPLLPIWIIAGKFVTRRYLASHQCVLMEKSLKFQKGVFTKIEKSIPLDKITDLGFVQGPLMRLFGIESLAIETAGQSGPGALVQMQGIQDARAFRDAVLRQRDRIAERESSHETDEAALPRDSSVRDTRLLEEIRDTLQRIETKLSDRG